jgi:hypothetical protein
MGVYNYYPPDPSGHSLLGDIIGIVAAVAAIFLLQPELIPVFLGGTVGAGTISITTAIISGFVGGFVGTLVSTGSLSAALTGGLIGAITAGAFYEAGTLIQGNNWGAVAERSLAHAAVGCASGLASGGNCGKGALSAAVSEAANSTVLHGTELAKWGISSRAAISGLIGGVAARIVGGNFAEGFSISAAGYLYNTAGHEHTYKIDVVAELDGVVGHTFLGYEIDDIPVAAEGFGVDGPTTAARIEAELLPDTPSTTTQDFDSFKAALKGAPGFAILRLPVDQATFYSTLGAFYSYASSNPVYHLGSVDCVHAVGYAINTGGVQTSLSHLNYSGITPRDVYDAINTINSGH